MKHLLLLTLFCLPTAQLIAQPPPGITENPEGAVRLQTIWRLIGGGSEETRVALAFGPAGDVNNDGYDDFFVTRRLRWDLYLGGPTISTEPAWSFSSGARQLEPNNEPVVGNFQGDGTMLVGLRDDRCTPNLSCYVRIRFFRPDPDSLLVETPLVLDLGEQPDGFRAFARDIDQDGDDELVVINEERDSVVVRIYGGSLTFQVADPMHTFSTLDSVLSTSHYNLYSGLYFLDSDKAHDLVISASHAATGETTTLIWLGKEERMPLWNEKSDRIVHVGPNDIGPTAIHIDFMEDYDGDEIVDFVYQKQLEEFAGVCIWLSRDKESVLTRAYTLSNAELKYPDAVRTRGFGFLADSLRRYEMLALDGRGPDTYGLVGGYHGPNGTYDATFGGSSGPAFGGIDVGDVDGNGWRDRLSASPTYGGPNVGGAVIIAGGPYIPVDDPTVSVESTPVAGEARGLSLWPNPVVDNLHIAWRGDLPQMPHLMRIYNALGELVEERGLPTWEGTTTWSAAGHPAGAYTIVLFDVEDRQLGTLPFVLQE